MWPSCELKLAISVVEENYDDDDDEDDGDVDGDDDDNNKLNLITRECPHEDLLCDIRRSIVRTQHGDRQTDTRTDATHVQKFIDTTYGRLTMAFASAAMYSELLLAAPLIH